MISFPNAAQAVSPDNKLHLCTMLYNTLHTDCVPAKVKKNIQEAFGLFLSDDAGSFQPF